MIKLVTEDGEFNVDVETQEVNQVKIVVIEGELKKKVLKRLEMTAKMDAGSSLRGVSINNFEAWVKDELNQIWSAVSKLEALNAQVTIAEEVHECGGCCDEGK